MLTMQVFYSNLFSAQQDPASGLLRVAQASLNEILAVRSELAWDIWAEG